MRCLRKHAIKIKGKEMEGKILNANYLANMFYIKDKTSRFDL